MALHQCVTNDHIRVWRAIADVLLGQDRDICDLERGECGPIIVECGQRLGLAFANPVGSTGPRLDDIW
jgi:hypothetical protein